MTDFLIAELDDRLEFGVAVVDDDVLNEYHSGCTNDVGGCCGDNGSCHNTVDCGCVGACS
jgi:hypothetical protein